MKLAICFALALSANTYAQGLDAAALLGINDAITAIARKPNQRRFFRLIPHSFIDAPPGLPLQGRREWWRATEFRSRMQAPLGAWMLALLVQVCRHLCGWAICAVSSQ